MEMNTRIQVEHTVTELVTGLDLVREQVLIAAGEPLSLRQEDVVLRGHAIECRINAEDPSRGFMPSPGRITSYREPAGPGVRVDSGVQAGSEIGDLYDPMIAKLIVHDTTRETARRRMLRALGEFEIGGVKSLLGFHQALLSQPCFIEGETCHGLVESRGAGGARGAVLSSGNKRSRRRRTDRCPSAATVAEVDGRRVAVKVLVPEPPYRALGRRRRERAAAGGRGAGSGVVVSPMQGTVLDVKVAEGDEVEVGQVLCIVEAMKMENEVDRARAGSVAELAVAPAAAGLDRPGDLHDRASGRQPLRACAGRRGTCASPRPPSRAESASSSPRCPPTEPQSVPGSTTSRAARTPQSTGLNFAAVCIQPRHLRPRDHRRGEEEQRQPDEVRDSDHRRLAPRQQRDRLRDTRERAVHEDRREDDHEPAEDARVHADAERERRRAGSRPPGSRR